MKLTIYPLTAAPLPVRPAEPRRDWMDATPERFAYRCLPLALANQHGWEVITPKAFTASWNGGHRPDDVSLVFDEPPEERQSAGPLANFGNGVLTFDLHFLLRTPPGWNILVTGPINGIKHGIAPLTGVIETDWSPYSFTMNWRFTQPGSIRFETGEAVAAFFPVRRDMFDRIEPVIEDLHTDPKTYKQFMVWRESRADFAERLAALEDSAVAQKWQKAYYRGLRPDGSPGGENHKIKLRVKAFTRSKK